jgi:hypothetical protein
MQSAEAILSYDTTAADLQSRDHQYGVSRLNLVAKPKITDLGLAPEFVLAC